jgi:hypothetical protein
MLQQIDACLTAAYDVRLASNSADRAYDTLKRCGAIKQLGRARDCSYEITGGLFELVNSEEADQELIGDINQRVNARCKQGV